VNWFVMLVSIFTWYGWFFWLLIPGYAFYQYGGLIKGWLFGGSGQVEQPQTEEEIAAEKKRLAKKERQASRVQYVQSR